MPEIPSLDQILKSINEAKVPPMSSGLPKPAGPTTTVADTMSRLGLATQTQIHDEALEHPPMWTPQYWLGTAKNLVMDVPEMLKGVGAMLEYGLHDIGGAIAQATPGEGIFGIAGGLERDVQQRGYSYGGNFWKAIGPSIKNDYMERYGLEGFDKFAGQLYNNPLSYVLDALMVGDIIAAPAKLGFLGDDVTRAILGISREEQLMANVGGKAALMRPYRVVADVMDPTWKTRISTSFNPVMRWAQNKVIDHILTRSATKTADMLTGAASLAAAGDTAAAGRLARLVNTYAPRSGVAATGLGAEGTIAPGLLAQAMDTVRAAEKAGIPVLRSWSMKSAHLPWTSTKFAQKLMGTAHQQTYQLMEQATAELKVICENYQKRVLEMGLVKTAEEANDRFWKFAQSLPGKRAIYEELLDVSQGKYAPLDAMPNTGPVEVTLPPNTVDIPYVTAPNIGSWTPPPVGPLGAVPRTGNPSIWEMLYKEVPGASRGSLRHWGHPTILSIKDGVEFSKEALGRRMSYTYIMGSMDNLPNEMARMREIFARNGHQYLGTVNTINKEEWWKGVHDIFQTPEGNVEMIYTTPQMMEGQEVAGHIMGMQQGNLNLINSEEALVAHLRDLKATKGNLVPPQTDEALAKHTTAVRGLNDDMAGALDMADHAFYRSIRAMNHPEGYDPTLEAADDLFNWAYRHGGSEFVEEYVRDLPNWALEGRPGPYTEMQNRMYGPLRHEMFQSMMLQIQNEVDSVYHEALRMAPRDAAGRLTKRSMAWMRSYIKERSVQEMQRFQIPDALARSSVEWGFPLKARGLNPAAGWKQQSTASAIAESLRQYARHGIVDDPTFEGWGWQTFRPAVLQPPIYFPHIRLSQMKPSDLLAKLPPDRIDQIAKSLPTPSRGWGGHVLEEGSALKDPWQAYQRTAAQYIANKEMGDVIRRATTVSRLVGPDELRDWQTALREGGYSAEVLWAPERTLRRLQIRTHVWEDVGDMMDTTGASYQDSLEAIIKRTNTMLQEMTAEELGNLQIYAIPRHVANQLTRTYFRWGKSGLSRIFYDGPMNMWRGTVLGLNPRWLIYNEAGNITFTAIDNPAALRRIFGSPSKKNREFLQYMLEQTDVPEGLGGGTLGAAGTRGFFTAESQQLRTANWGAAEINYPNWTQLADRTLSRQWVGLPHRIAAKTRHWNSVLEQTARRGIMIDEYARARLEGARRLFENDFDLAANMARNGIDPQTLPRMMESANRTLGNYTTLGPIERDVIRRYIIPFYPFYRHIFKFAVRMPLEHPLKSQVFRQLAELDKEMAPILPDYLSASIPLGMLGGMNAYLNVQNFNPLNQWYQQGEEMSVLSPVLKVLAQGLTGTNDFGEPYTADNVYVAGNGMKFIRTEDGWEPFYGKVHPPWWKMALAQFGTPMQYFNLQGYKTPTNLTRILGQLGISVSRLDTAKYQQNVMEGEIESSLYGGK